MIDNLLQICQSDICSRQTHAKLLKTSKPAVWHRLAINAFLFADYSVPLLYNKSTRKNMKQNRENPFFETYRTRSNSSVRPDRNRNQYEPAFDEGIWQLDEEVRAIADNTELPTFENTIIALERSGKLLDKVISAFFNVLNAEADDEMMDISQRVSPKLSESSNNIYLNEQLFARVKSVYDRKDELHLLMEDARLLGRHSKLFAHVALHSDLKREENTVNSVPS